MHHAAYAVGARPGGARLGAGSQARITDRPRNGLGSVLCGLHVCCSRANLSQIRAQASLSLRYKHPTINGTESRNVPAGGWFLPLVKWLCVGVAIVWLTGPGVPGRTRRTT